MSRRRESFRTLYCDPGEDFGWCVGRDLTLLSAGTTKMWSMADDAWAALSDPSDTDIPLSDPLYAREGVTEADLTLPIGRIVCEDWRLYPWELKNMHWDQCRTARVIGALTFMARLHSIPIIFQPAAIKEAAKAAGAEELYYRPLKENRHQNDAIQHFVYFTNTELLGLKLPVPAVNKEER